MRFGRGGTAAAGALILLLGLAPACGRDDGATVRNTGPGGGSGAAGSGSGSGSASGSGAASASETSPECHPVGDASTAARRVLVKLTEWKVRPADPSAPAGRINFHTENAGKEAHELVIVKGSDPAALPTGKDGSVDEDKLPQGAFVGEVEPFPANTSCDGTFDLTAGSYVLFCNVVETEADGTKESHYQEGMRTAFTAT